MNILYLAHRIPYPPDKGDKLRSYREIEYLARRHKVWCACFVDTATDDRHVFALKAFCRDVAVVRLNRTWAKVRGLAGLVRGGTMTESFYSHTALREILRRWCQSVKFDAVIAFSSSMAPYALNVPAGRHVLDICDLDSRKWLDYADASRGLVRRVYRAEGRRLAAIERKCFETFDATLLTTQAEAAPLVSTEKRGKLHIVGNGVSLPDLDGRAGNVTRSAVDVGAAPVADSDGSGDERPWRPTVGFVGVMDYRPNVDAVSWFVSNCWKDIRASFPEAVFRIVGRSPSRQVRKLAAVEGVEVVGGVPDAAAEVRGFDVSVAPMRLGRGLQNKVLEAMAAARPVVLTSKAAQGVAGRHEHEYLVADGPRAFAESVVRLLDDPIERKRLGRMARSFVAANHGWEETLRRFELIVTGAVVRTARRRPMRRAAATVEREEVVTAGAV